MLRLRLSGASKWALLVLLICCFLLPVSDIFTDSYVRMWSPLFYLEYIALSMSLPLDLVSALFGALALAAWGLLYAEKPVGRYILSALFAPAATIYLILFLYVLLTFFFRNRHNTFFTEILADFFKLFVSTGVLFFQHTWCRDRL